MDFSSRLRAAFSTATAGARMLHRSGLLGAFSPVAAARFARDAVKRGATGGAMILHLHALTDPLRPAVVAGDERLSYGELDAQINRIAHGLYRRGVGHGDRVGLLLRNTHEYIVLNAALGYLGAVAVQIGYRLKPPEVVFVLKNSGARALVFHREFEPTVEAAVAEAGLPPRDACISIGGQTKGGFTTYAELLAAGDPDAPPKVSGAGGYGGVMVYTSGTTGRPKGARRDLRESGFETVLHFMSEVPLRRDERHLVVCPLYHSAAPAFVMLTFVVGGCVVVMENFEPEEVLRTIERERITSLLAVPTMWNRLVSIGLPALRKYDLSSLRWILSGAAPLPTELARRIEEAFGPILYNFYGATETGFVTLARPGEHTARPGTIGRLVPGNEVRILDEQGHDVVEGEVGELYIRSTMLMQGYHGDDEATAKAQKDGFVSVGDLARRDADGYYYLADRKSDMVISGGVNIYPLEIEQRLHDHPSVAEAAVVGFPDPEWGESLAAFVVLREGQEAGKTVTEEALRQFVGEALADYKRPRRVTFVSELPRTPTGKVLKRELRLRLTAAG